VKGYRLNYDLLLRQSGNLFLRQTQKLPKNIIVVLTNARSVEDIE